MPKYHINDKGNPGICHAQAGNCPFHLTEAEHGSTPQEARDLYEKRMQSKLFDTKPKYPHTSQKKQERRRKILKRSSAAVVLGATAVLATSLTGCSANNGSEIKEDYVRVCQNKQTEQRVDDKSCENNGGTSASNTSNAFLWYYLMTHNNNNNPTRIPAVGERVSGGTTSIPAGSTYRSGVSPKGTTVSGTNAKSGSGESDGKGGSVSKGGVGGDSGGHAAGGHAGGSGAGG